MIKHSIYDTITMKSRPPSPFSNQRRRRRRRRLSLHPPRRPKVISPDVYDPESTLLCQRADVSIPPASPTLRVFRRESVEDPVEPRVMRPPVLEQHDPAAGRRVLAEVVQQRARRVVRADPHRLHYRVVPPRERLRGVLHNVSRILIFRVTCYKPFTKTVPHHTTPPEPTPCASATFPPPPIAKKKRDK